MKRLQAIKCNKRIFSDFAIKIVMLGRGCCVNIKLCLQ